MGDGCVIQATPTSNKKNKKKNKNRGRTKKKMTHDQLLAFKFVSDWVFLDHPSASSSSSSPSAASCVVDDFGVQKPVGRGGEKLVFELHSHSKFSDGFFSPSKVIERAHINGVKVLALTDHDTMAGIPEAVESARKYGIKIIPGVEISSIFSPRVDSELEEPVHILAYYSSIGPSRFEELDKFLSNIRDGRFLRAKNIVLKLNKLKLPLKWEHVCRIAGKGVAPGRLHVARAMVEAGCVENLRQAFARYLFDGGPAYSKGSEPLAEEAVKMICHTGGVAVLAHPWALKHPVPIVRRLKEAGLHGMEVHKSDGKLAAYSDLADAYGLLKIGGSDYHGRGGHNESGEFMLLANRVAAEVICRAYPDAALLRRHPEPNMRKLREFMAFCQKHGFELNTTSSGQFHCSLEQIREKLKGDPVLYYILISYATRPMQLASYFCSGDLKDSENEWGHYALAVPFYTHFTSPLRRYPDIIVHRTLLATIEAEDLYAKQVYKEIDVEKRCFTGINFDKSAAASIKGREALSVAAVKYIVPGAEALAKIAAHCNERKLASRNVKDACDKLYIWFLLKKKEVLFSEARILGLGPRFMSIYIQKLAIERRIYYDDVEGLTAEWLETTSTLVLSMSTNTCTFRRGWSNKWRAIEEVALLSCPYNQSDVIKKVDGNKAETEIDPSVFPLTVHVLSTIPVALHAVGGDDGPLDIGVRLYMSSYFYGIKC